MKELSQRQLQVGEKIKRELSTLWHSGRLDVPRVLSMLSFSEVRMTADLKTAMIFYTMPLNTDHDDVRHAIEPFAKEVRYQLAKVLTIKYMPELKFIEDTSLDEAAKIDALLNSDKVKEDLAKEDEA